MSRSAFSFRTLSLCQLALLVISISLLIRLVSLAIYPLMDTTEARYGEMARIMAETGNWVTPMFDYNVPFWGKPPLFSWLSAGGITLLGNSEFAVRAPHLLVGAAVVFLTFVTASQTGRNRSESLLAAAILSSTAAFIVISGAVMTDTALTLGITLSMMGFWLAWQNGSRLCGYLFFVGLAIGMLAKGPLTLVLAGISITLWSASEGRWKVLHRKLPWVKGSLLFAAVTLPWYLLAEWKTPGFLNYFIIGEHFMRFVVGGWEGDLYGSAHEEVRGTIWIFGLLAALPWTPLFFWQLVRRFRQGAESEYSTNGYIGFLWCWMIAPLILFTFAGNILSSYVMPGLPAFALLLAAYHTENPLGTKIYRIGLVTPALIATIALALMSGVTSKTAEKQFLADWKTQPEAQSSDLFYLGKRPFSAQYYSEGKAKFTSESLPHLAAQLSHPAFVAVNRAQLSQASPPDSCESRLESRKRIMMFCQPTGLNGLTRHTQQ